MKEKRCSFIGVIFLVVFLNTVLPLNSAEDSGFYVIPVGQNQTQLDARYLNATGDSMEACTAGSLLGVYADCGNGSDTGRAMEVYSYNTGGNTIQGTNYASGGIGIQGINGGQAPNGVGVLGTASGTNSIGVKGEVALGNGWAGYFQGKMYVSGNVGIGKTNPDHKLHVAGISKFEVGGGSIAISTPGGWPGVIAYSPNGHRRDVQYYDGFMSIAMSNSSSAPAYDNGITINENGTVGVKVLQIIGGSDLSEQFDIRSPREGLEPSPGMVVSIDPEEPGELVVSHQAYDRKVAGIISGAGGVNPGMLMGQKGTEANGSSPVALSGRVHCLVDASYGPIEPGDLLTSSPTPGHAMRATDYTKARGATIGKAMTGHREGKGLVLVLVTLQ